MKRLIGLAGLVLWMSLQSASAAVTVTDFRFFGVDVEPVTGVAEQVDIVMRLSYDTSQLDGDPANPALGTYNGSLSVLSGGQTAGPVGVIITVENGVTDHFLVPASFGSPFPTLGSGVFSDSRLEIVSNSGSLFPTDALPLDASFANAADAQIFVGFGANDSLQNLDVQSFQIVAGPSAVPEPSTYGLLIAGLAIIFLVRGARRV